MTNQDIFGDKYKKPNDPMRAIGCSLKESEWIILEGIAEEVGVTRGFLISFAARKFIDDYKNGRIKTRTTKRLPQY